MSKISKPSENSKESTKPSAKKKYILIGGLFVVCALLLKRDAH